MSKKKKKYKYECYMNILRAIKKSCPFALKPGTTGNLFIDTFLVNNGILKAGIVEKLKLCKPKEFKKWRQQYIDSGWLVWEHGSYSKHSPGPKLLYYLNQEKIKIKEIATKDEIVTKDEHENLKDKLNKTELQLDIQKLELNAAKKQIEKKASKHEVMILKKKNHELETIIESYKDRIESYEERVECIEKGAEEQAYQNKITRKAVENLIEKFDPPATEEKIENQIRIANIG